MNSIPPKVQVDSKAGHPASGTLDHHAAAFQRAMSAHDTQAAIVALETVSFTKPASGWVVSNAYPKAVMGKISPDVLRLLQLLHAKGFDIYCSSQAVKTLTRALAHHDQPVLQFLLTKAARFIPKFTDAECSQLFDECKANMQLFLELLKAGVRPDIADPKEIPPLFHAVCAGEKGVEVVQYLIDQGVNINKACGSADRTALHIASLVADGFPSLQLLIQGGALLDQPDADGSTPLMLAVHRSSPATVRYLIEQGANPYLTDSAGSTPFDWASEEIRQLMELEVAKKEAKHQAELLDQGARPAAGPYRGSRL